MGLKTAFYKVLFIVPTHDKWDPGLVARELNVSYSTAKRYIKELMRLGLVEEVSTNKFKLSREGIVFRNSILNYINYLLAFERGEKREYVFRDKYGEPIPVAVSNIEQLYAVIKYDIVPWSIVKDKIADGTLIEWIREGLGDHDLAMKLESIKNNNITKNEIIKVLEDRLKIINCVINIGGGAE